MFTAWRQETQREEGGERVLTGKLCPASAVRGRGSDGSRGKREQEGGGDDEPTHMQLSERKQIRDDDVDDTEGWAGVIPLSQAVLCVMRDVPVQPEPEGGVRGCTGPWRPPTGAGPGWGLRPGRRCAAS